MLSRTMLAAVLVSTGIYVMQLSLLYILSEQFLSTIHGKAVFGAITSATNVLLASLSNLWLFERIRVLCALVGSRNYFRPSSGYELVSTDGESQTH